MQLRSLVFVLALMMVAGMVCAQQSQDQTICVPAPAQATPTPAGAGAGTMADIDQFNANFVSSYFGICEADVTSLRAKYDWPTVYFVANVASKTGRPVSEITALVDQGMSWNDIACRYNLTLADLRQPVACPTPAAVSIAPIGAGPGMTPGQARMGSWISDAYGNVILTEREDRRLKKMGYTWEDIAVATNIAMLTGDPVYQVLQWNDRGMTWTQVGREYGIDPCGGNILDISCYPFQKDNTLAAPTCPVGAGPCPAPEPCPAPACPAPAPQDNSCPPVGAGPAPCPPTEPANPCAPCPAPEQAPVCPAPQNTCPSPNTPSTY